MLCDLQWPSWMILLRYALRVGKDKERERDRKKERYRERARDRERKRVWKG